MAVDAEADTCPFCRSRHTMDLFKINRRVPETIWKIMKHMNLLILLYITVISYHAIMELARSNSAGLFIKSISVLPLESTRFVVSVFILYGALLLLFRLDLEEEQLRLVKVMIEVAVSVMITLVCGMAYTGIIILVMVDIIHGSYTMQRKVKALIFVIIVYFIMDSEILNLWYKHVSFSDYLIFYNSKAAGILQSILNIMELVNIVMFILFLIVSLRNQMDETARIMLLNEELTEANIKLEEYSRKSAEMAQMKERNRLAREIHDTIGHALTGIVTGLEACLVIFDLEPSLARKQMEAIQEVARQGMKDVRRSVNALRPDVLEQLTLDAAIERMVDEMCRSTGIRFDYICTDSLSGLDQDEEDIVYRILQESITNSVRHGKPTRINIQIERTGQQLEILIRDNGIGCRDLHKGFGLTHMQERLDMLGGTLSVNGNDGFEVRAEIPLRFHTGEVNVND